jgi:hypothetical protein
VRGLDGHRGCRVHDDARVVQGGGWTGPTDGTHRSTRAG